MWIDLFPFIVGWGKKEWLTYHRSVVPQNSWILLGVDYRWQAEKEVLIPTFDNLSLYRIYCSKFTKRKALWTADSYNFIMCLTHLVIRHKRLSIHMIATGKWLWTVTIAQKVWQGSQREMPNTGILFGISWSLWVLSLRLSVLWQQFPAVFL